MLLFFQKKKDNQKKVKVFRMTKAGGDFWYLCVI